MNSKSRLLTLFCQAVFSLVLLFVVRPLAAGEVVLYQGEQKGLTFGEGNPIRHFQEVFYIDEQLLAKQKEIDLREIDPPISMADAAASVARRLELGRIVIWKVVLINHQAKTTNNLSKGVFFNVLTLQSARGRNNYVVLMDGTIILPRKKFRD